MFGENLKYYREKAGMTQKELADRVGVSAPHITQLERGTRQATSPVISVISEILDVSTDELIKGRAAV